MAIASGGVAGVAGAVTGCAAVAVVCAAEELLGSALVSSAAVGVETVVAVAAMESHCAEVFSATSVALSRRSLVGVDHAAPAGGVLDHGDALSESDASGGCVVAGGCTVSGGSVPSVPTTVSGGVGSGSDSSVVSLSVSDNSEVPDDSLGVSVDDPVSVAVLVIDGSSAVVPDVSAPPELPTTVAGPELSSDSVDSDDDSLAVELDVAVDSESAPASAPDDCADDELGASDPDGSAQATPGELATAVPMPNATAKAPTRPIAVAAPVAATPFGPSRKPAEIASRLRLFLRCRGVVCVLVVLVAIVIPRWFAATPPLTVRCPAGA